MKRVLLHPADLKDNVYWFNGSPFSGVGFVRDIGDIVEPYQLAEGRITGSYVSICEEGRNISERIDLRGASGDCEPVLRTGERFSGMGYEFKGDYCTYEGFFEGGGAVSEVWYNRDGLMTRCILSQASLDFTELYDWYDDGRVDDCTIQTTSSFWCSIRFRVDGLLRHLMLTNGTLRALDEVARKAKFFPVANILGFSQLRAGKDFLLYGNDIDDDFVALLIRSGVFRLTEKLELENTMINSLDVRLLAEMPELKVVSVLEKDLRRITLAQSIMRNRPDLSVAFNQLPIEW